MGAVSVPLGVWGSGVDRVPLGENGPGESESESVEGERGGESVDAGAGGAWEK